MSRGVSPVVSLTHGLPDGYMVRPFGESARLNVDVAEVLRRFQDNGDGNQWILLVALSSGTIEKLGNQEYPLEELNYRFQWDGTIGLIKVIVASSHVSTTDQLTRSIDHHISAMRNPQRETKWVANTAYKPTATKGKQADQAFLPSSRFSPISPTWMCPTLVIETGVSQSLPRFRENAKWWFENSNGDVRMVLILTISESNIRFEKWQLAPPNAPRPMSAEYIHALCQQSPPVPPLVQQPPETQQAYMAQEIEVNLAEAIGTSLVLPFAALFDQVPGPGDEDVVLGPQDLRSITECLF